MLISWNYFILWMCFNPLGILNENLSFKIGHQNWSETNSYIVCVKEMSYSFTIAHVGTSWVFWDFEPEKTSHKTLLATKMHISEYYFISKKRKK